MIPSGIAVSLPGSGYAAFVFARSGLGVKHGISLSNGVGVIDSDYRGEICVGLCNLGTQPYEIQPGERIAQLVVMPVCPLPVQEAAELDQTQRGASGFGSARDGRLRLHGEQEKACPAGSETAEMGKDKAELRSETAKPVCLREKTEICLGRGAF